MGNLLACYSAPRRPVSPPTPRDPRLTIILETPPEDVESVFELETICEELESLDSVCGDVESLYVELDRVMGGMFDAHADADEPIYEEIDVGGGADAEAPAARPDGGRDSGDEAGDPDADDGERDGPADGSGASTPFSSYQPSPLLYLPRRRYRPRRGGGFRRPARDAS